jgi:hypothetical protein
MLDGMYNVTDFDAVPAVPEAYRNYVSPCGGACRRRNTNTHLLGNTRTSFHREEVRYILQSIKFGRTARAGFAAFLLACL